MSSSQVVATAADRDFLVQALRLTLVPGVGPRLRQSLLAHFSTADAVLSAAPSELRKVPGIGAKISQAIARANDTIDAEAEIELCRQQGIQILIDPHPPYPPALREIHDPPGVLFVLGSLLPSDELAVAIVGSRHATQYGLATA